MTIPGAKNGLYVTVATLLLLPAAVGLADTGRVPPSTNPSNLAIFPSKGQDTSQQMEDQLASYNWATQQTGWDPYQAHDVLVQQGYAAAQTAQKAQGGLIKGGARGALGGLAIGAIAGNAGKGAAIGAVVGGMTGGIRSRRRREAAQSQADQALQAFNAKFQTWTRNYTASMEGRGYSVK